MLDEKTQHPFSYLRSSMGARSLQTGGFESEPESSTNPLWLWIIIIVVGVVILSVVLICIRKSLKNNYLGNKLRAKLQFGGVAGAGTTTDAGWPSFEPDLDLVGYPDEKWVKAFGSSPPPLWKDAVTSGGQVYNGSLHGSTVDEWKVDILERTSSDARSKFLERRLVISYPHVLNSMDSEASKARWRFRGEEGVGSTRSPVARNVLESDVTFMKGKQLLSKVWFDGAKWPEWPVAEGPATAANGLRPYVLDGSYVGVHVATPSQLDYGVDAFDGVNPREECHELNVWFQYVTTLHELAQCDTPPAVPPPGCWPIIYRFHERYWMLAEACAGILHTRIDFMPDSKRRVAEMIRTMNYLLDPALCQRMTVARDSLEKASSSCWAWLTGKRSDIPVAPTKTQMDLAQMQLKEKLAQVSRWAALIGGVSGPRPRQALLAAFLEPMATAALSKQSDRITVFAMLAYIFEHVYGSGLGPMEALRKYDREDDKLYRAWECMSNGSVLLPDGFTSEQIARLERNYLYEVCDVDVPSIFVKVGARFSMPVRLPGRGFMGSMSITPWKPLFLRALWRCRGLVKEVNTARGSSRNDRVEDGTYTQYLGEDEFKMRMQHMQEFDVFITGLQTWYLPLVSSDLPWCWDESTRILVLPVVDMRQLREMKPEWDGTQKVLRVHMTEDGIFPRVHCGIDKTYNLSEHVTIWQFAFRIPDRFLGSKKGKEQRNTCRNKTAPVETANPATLSTAKDLFSQDAYHVDKNNSSSGRNEMSGAELGASHSGVEVSFQGGVEETKEENDIDPLISQMNTSQTHWNQELDITTSTMTTLDESSANASQETWTGGTVESVSEQAQFTQPLLLTARLGFLSHKWGVHTVMGPEDIDRLYNPQDDFESYVCGPQYVRVVPGQPVQRDNWSDVKMINSSDVHTPKILYGLPASCDNLYGEKWTGEAYGTVASKQGWQGVNFPKFNCGFDTEILWSPQVEWK